MASNFSAHIRTIVTACEILEGQYNNLGVENANLRRQLALPKTPLRETLDPVVWRGAKPLPATPVADETEDSRVVSYEEANVTPRPSGYQNEKQELDFGQTLSKPGAPEDRWASLVQRVLNYGQMTYWALSCWVSGPKADTDLVMISAAANAKVQDEEDPNDEIMAAFRLGMKTGWLQTRPGLTRGVSDFLMTVVNKVRSETSDSGRHGRSRSGTDSDEGGLVGKSSQGMLDCLGPPLHPAGQTRIAWNLLSLLWICFDAVMVSLEVFDLPDAVAWKTLEWFGRCFWTIDILMSCRTGFYENYKYETRPLAILKHYMRTWFIVDIVALLPDYISIAVSGEYDDIVKPTKLIRVLRLVRAFKMRFFIHAILETMNSLKLLLLSDLVAYSLMVMLWVHICGCLWYAIGKSTDRSWLTINDFVQMELPHSYFVSVQWAVTQLQGNVDIKTADNAGEAGFHISMTLCSIVVLAIFISKLTNMMIQLEQASRTKARQLRSLQDYLSMYRVSTDVSMKVKRYAEQKLSIESKQMLKEQELITILPKALRRSLLQEVRGPRLEMNNPFFQACKLSLPKLYRRLCCDVVDPAFSEPDTLVYTYSEACFEVLFLMAGDVTYDHYNNSVLGTFLRKNKNRAANGGRNFSLGLSDDDRDEEGASNGGSTRGTTTELRIQRQKTTFNFAHSMSKVMFRERLEQQGLVLNATNVDVNHCLCEASLWTRWSHKGDLAAQSHASFLVINAEKFTHIVDFDNEVKRFGAQHAFRFCRVLNSPDVKLTDLLNSEDIIYYDLAQKRKVGRNTKNGSCTFSD